MKLDLKHLRKFAFSMTAKKSGESIIALIDEIEQLNTYDHANHEIDYGTKAKQALTKWTEFTK